MVNLKDTFMPALTVQLLLTGNELMSGDVVDSNSAMIALKLKELGIELKRKVTISDDLALLIDEIKHLSKQADVLIINGGLGPTVDDLTAQALAQAAEQTIALNDDAHTHLQHWCQARNTSLTQQNLKQAMLPKEAVIVANRVGSAVGFSLTLNNCEIICTPGVPPELNIMLDEQIIPALSEKLPQHLKTHVTRLQVFGFGESGLQKIIDEQLPDWPEDIELGFRAATPLLEVKLTSRTPAAAQLKAVWLEKLATLLGEHIFNVIESKPLSMAEIVVDSLQKQQKKITLAESCTGGLIASKVTKISGASQVFEAGYVTYSNNIKMKMVNVKPSTLEQFGAVSEACVIEMAQGALLHSQADVAIAVSGIAGPDGGTDEKPVGTVCIAWGSKDNMQSCSLLIPGNRNYFQEIVATTALDLIRRHLSQSSELPRYLVERKLLTKRH